jgi:hypothetical protein
VRAVRPGREADEVSATQRVLPVGCANDDSAVDDEEPFLFVLVVVRGAGLSRRKVVDVHGEGRGLQGTRDVDLRICALKMLTVSIWALSVAEGRSTAHATTGRDGELYFRPDS